MSLVETASLRRLRPINPIDQASAPAPRPRVTEECVKGLFTRFPDRKFSVVQAAVSVLGKPPLPNEIIDAWFFLTGLVDDGIVRSDMRPNYLNPGEMVVLYRLAKPKQQKAPNI